MDSGLPTPADESERKVVSDVQIHGWHVVKVFASAERPEFAYTIGLQHNFGHPELIVFGLSSKIAHAALNVAGDNIRAGACYQAGTQTDQILNQYLCAFRPVPLAQYREHLGFALWFYRGSAFQALQLIYPDREGRWPWQDGVSHAFRQGQPLLDGVVH